MVPTAGAPAWVVCDGVAAFVPPLDTPVPTPAVTPKPDTGADPPPPVLTASVACKPAWVTTSPLVAVDP